MSLASLFGWSFGSADEEMPTLFPLPITEKDFVSIDVVNIYTKILIDVLERTQGIPEDLQSVLWDNCVKSESTEGLVTFLAKAMTDKKDLFLIFDSGLNLIRKANSSEEAAIKAAYAKGQKAPGVFISFSQYTKTDMVRFYSALEYATAGGLWKSMNLSKAVQLKVSDLRSSVSMVDKADVKAQARAMARGLSEGKDILGDAKDIIETAEPKLDAANASVAFIDKKRGFYLGMPASYLSGELTKGGLSDTGQSDAKAIDRGLKFYFFSIVKPVIKALFDKNVSFKSDDSQEMSTVLEALKTFEIVSDEFLSAENKLKTVNKLIGLPENTKGGPPAPEVDPLADPKNNNFDPKVPPKKGVPGGEKK